MSIDADKSALYIRRTWRDSGLRDAIAGYYATIWSPFNRNCGIEIITSEPNDDVEWAMPDSNSIRKMVKYHDLALSRILEMDDIASARERLRFIQVLCFRTSIIASQIGQALDLDQFETEMMNEIADLPEAVSRSR